MDEMESIEKFQAKLEELKGDIDEIFQEEVGSIGKCDF